MGRRERCPGPRTRDTRPGDSPGLWDPRASHWLKMRAPGTLCDSPRPTRSRRSGTKVLERPGEAGETHAGHGHHHLHGPTWNTDCRGRREVEASASEALLTLRQSHHSDASRSSSCKHRLGRSSETPGRLLTAWGCLPGGLLAAPCHSRPPWAVLSDQPCPQSPLSSAPSREVRSPRRRDSRRPPFPH